MVASSMLVTGCLNGDSVVEDVFYGDDILPFKSVTPFTLLDENGAGLNILDHQGKVIVIAFLFTRCPDICPVISANLKYISLELGDKYPNDVAIFSITVDPWTDNSSVLLDYRIEKNLTWPHLTGELPILEEVWKNFGVGLTTYDSDNDSDGVVDGFDSCPDTPANESVDSDGCGIETQGGDSTAGRTTGRTSGRHHPADYWVDHTTGTVIIDKKMQQRVWWADADWNAELLLKDIEFLLKES